MTTLRKTFITAVFFGLCGPVAAQSPESRILKAAMDSLSQRRLEIHAAQQVMSKRADSVAQAISRLKAKSTSPLETRSLNEVYRASQVLADSLQSLQTRAQGVDRGLRQKAETLLKNLNTEITSLAEAKSTAKKTRDLATDRRLNVELQSCRQWQKICRQILDEPPPPILIYEVRVEPDDDARTLLRKADFLRDQADRLARELEAFEQKLAVMREEASLRKRMQEFSQDLALLDPINEGLRQTGAADQDPALSSENAGGLETRMGDDALARIWVEPLISFSWPGNINDLSDRDLQEWQKRLQQWHALRQAQADSLRQRAEEIEKLGRAKEE